MAKPRLIDYMKKRFLAYNVCVIDPKATYGMRRQSIGPYTKEHAYVLMLEHLSNGICAWVEEDYVKVSIGHKPIRKV
tara:strand:- start:1029 stop:1259 length:231 start_codon:yes stop_codon:yes gene_type:complete